MKSDQPPKLNHPAPPWFNQKWNELCDWVRSQMPVSSETIQVTDADGGGKRFDYVGFVPTVRPAPFETRWLNQDEGQVKVAAGTVNEFVPDTVGGIDDWTFSISPGEYIYLEAEMDGDGTVTGAHITVGAIPSQPTGDPETGSAPASSYRPVARLTVDGELQTFLNSSQWVTTYVSRWDADVQVVRVMWNGRDTI